MGGAPIQDPREFVSTDKQRMYTAGLFASCAALGLRGVTGVAIGEDGGDPLAYGGLLASCAMAYWLSDLGTGVFHWSVDNYGSKNTPVMGGIIDAFQGHHKYPWTITKRQFANNIHTTCPATMCVTVPLLLAPGMSPQACASWAPSAASSSSPAAVPLLEPHEEIRAPEAGHRRPGSWSAHLPQGPRRAPQAPVQRQLLHRQRVVERGFQRRIFLRAEEKSTRPRAWRRGAGRTTTNSPCRRRRRRVGERASSDTRRSREEVPQIEHE